MTRRLAWAVESHGSGGAAAAGRRPVADPSWRSHTYADGVRALTITGRLDVGAAGRLWARISQLLERGCRRLIVDARAIDAGGEEAALLAGAFAGQPASCEAVVVAPPGSMLGDMLPPSVGVTRSLTDARAQLRRGVVRRDARSVKGPAGRISEGDRATLAIRQSLRWASRSAREGDYERALEWLSMVERMEGRLPATWRNRREAWLAAWKTQAITRNPQRTPRRGR